MKTAKQLVYDFVQQNAYRNEKGIDTLAIANELGMLRTNASALLNELVKEGKLIKTSTRPVYYRVLDNIRDNEEMSFQTLIGYDGSLRKPIQLAKAAILYPNQSLNVLISCKVGCGTTSFAYAMYCFARENGVIKKEAPYVKINCRHFSKNISVLDNELFGIGHDLNKSCFMKAKGGVLFLDNVDLLDAKQQSQLYTFLETNMIYSEDGTKSKECKDIFVIISQSPQSNMQFERIIPVIIELPELKDRSIKERFGLINHFFSNEASHSMRSIEVTSETIRALLLSDFDYNVKELKFEIKAACANAYVRVVRDIHQNIQVVVNDFKNQVRKSLIKLKNNHIEIEALLDSRNVLIYDQNDGYQTIDTTKHGNDMYLEISKQYNELLELGINDHGISDVITTHIQNLFKKYNYLKSYDSSLNLKQLSKIVDSRVIEIVSHFFQTSKKELGKNYRTNVFYGLCLHINSIISLKESQQRITNDQVVQIIQDHPSEYAASVQLASIIKDEFDLDLPVHEVALIAMFLIETEDQTKNNPVLLYILHGETTASSLRDTTNSLTQCYNAYSYDLALNIDTHKAMEEIKDLIMKIDKGQGVIVIYDMGSIKTMLETIEEETNIKIRLINMPITLIGIDIARRCSMESDIDYIYHLTHLEMNKMRNYEEKLNQVIVTLCHTGEGGAIQLKRYIDQYSKLNMKTIPLAISAKDELIHEVSELRKTYDIHCFVGTYDPKIFGIPFIPISKIFENSQEEIDRILMFEPISSSTFNYEDVYQYLSEQFKYVSISKLKSILPGIIDELNTIYHFNEDQRVGLFMHMACLVERLLDGKQSVPNIEKQKILSVFHDEYQSLSKIFKPLEKAFHIIIDDNEMTTILMIIKRI